jgi:hypothetical protein
VVHITHDNDLVIEIENSLSAFIERIGLNRDGYTIRTIKDQLARLAAADFPFRYHPRRTTRPNNQRDNRSGIRVVVSQE